MKSKNVVIGVVGLAVVLIGFFAVRPDDKTEPTPAAPESTDAGGRAALESSAQPEVGGVPEILSNNPVPANPLNEETQEGNDGMPIDSEEIEIDPIVVWRAELRELVQSESASPEAIVELLNRAIEEWEPAALRAELGVTLSEIEALSPGLLAEVMTAMPDRRNRHLVLASMVDTMLSTDPVMATEWVSQLPDAGGRGEAYELLSRNWAGQDLEAVTEWVGGLDPISLDAAKANEGLIWSWMQKDPDAAVEYAQSLEHPVLQKRAFDKAAKILSVSNPAAATDWASGFPDQAQREELVDYSVYRWAKKDPDAAREWVESSEDEAVRRGATAALVRSWSDSNPGEAAQWVVENMSGAESNLPLLNATQKWATSAPAEAAEWINSLGDQATRGWLFENLSQAMGRREPEVQEAWAAALPEDFLVPGVPVSSPISSPTPTEGGTP